MYRPISFAVGLMLLAGCSPPESAAVEEAGRALMAALNANDVDGILAGLTPGHMTMAPDEPILPNGPRLRSWHEARIAETNTEFEMTTESIVVAEDWAIQRWSAVVTSGPRFGSSSTNDYQKGIWVWQRQADGEWKLDGSIWNSDDRSGPVVRLLHTP